MKLLKRKNFIVLILMVIMINILEPAFAGDPLYIMMHSENQKPKIAVQDAIVVGQLLEKNQDVFKAKVLKVISGKIDSKTILIESNFEYGWSKKAEFKPKAKDYFVMSLKKSGKHYKQAFGTFKADSGNYKTLKLLTEKICYSSGNADVACIQWYVNSGGTERNFSFVGDKAYLDKVNGSRTQIYP